MMKVLRRPRERAIVSVYALGLAMAAPLASQAQSTPAASTVPQARLSEVVVTAERRTTDIQKTPTAITALPAVTLDKSFVTDVTGLNGRVPSLQSTKESGFENIITIRGIGSETPENDLTTVPGVSLFEDGVYLVNTISLSQTLFDVDRVEVLRGPAGRPLRPELDRRRDQHRHHAAAAEHLRQRRRCQRRHLRPGAGAGLGQHADRRHPGPARLGPAFPATTASPRIWRFPASARTTPTTPL